MKYSGFMTVHINNKETEIYFMCLKNLKRNCSIFTSCFVILNLCILLAVCVFVFRTVLTVTNDYFPQDL
jgi:hypothetical protein